jgi:hypothetical protein
MSVIQSTRFRSNVHSPKIRRKIKILPLFNVYQYGNIGTLFIFLMAGLDGSVAHRLIVLIKWSISVGCSDLFVR